MTCGAVKAEAVTLSAVDRADPLDRHPTFAGGRCGGGGHGRLHVLPGDRAGGAAADQGAQIHPEVSRQLAYRRFGPDCLLCGFVHGRRRGGAGSVHGRRRGGAGFARGRAGGGHRRGQLAGSARDRGGTRAVTDQDRGAFGGCSVWSLAGAAGGAPASAKAASVASPSPKETSPVVAAVSMATIVRDPHRGALRVEDADDPSRPFAGISTAALAVSTSTIGWFWVTTSPSPTSHLRISASGRPSPRSGSGNSLTAIAVTTRRTGRRRPAPGPGLVGTPPPVGPAGRACRTHPPAAPATPVSRNTPQ